MVTVFAGPKAIETVRGEEPQYRLREIDQVAPAGMWRIDVQADEMLFQRATAADWSTSLTVVTLQSTGVVIYSGSITFSGDVTLEDDVKLNFGTSSDFSMDFDSAGSTFDFVAGSTTVLQVAKASGDATFAQDVTVTGSLYVGTDLDVDGTANLDIVDIDGNTQIDGTLSVGINDTGQDVTFYGATDGAYLLWDESLDDLILNGGAGFQILADNPTWSTEHLIVNNTGGNGVLNKICYKAVTDATATSLFTITTYSSATHGGGEYVCLMKAVVTNDSGNNASGACVMGWEGAFAVANQHNMGDGTTPVVEILQTSQAGPDTTQRGISDITVTVTSSADNVHTANFDVNGTGSATPALRVTVYVQVVHAGYRYSPVISQD